MGSYDRQSIFSGANDVWIELNHTTAHASLEIAGIRYDGEIYPHSGEVRRKQSRIKEGTYLKLTGIPEENLALLRARLSGLSSEALMSVSCYHGICQHLEASGIYIPTEKPIMKWPSEIFRKLITHGLVTESGVPVKIEIFRTQRGSLEMIERMLQEREEAGLQETSDETGAVRNLEIAFAAIIGTTAILAIGVGLKKKPKERLPQPSPSPVPGAY